MTLEMTNKLWHQLPVEEVLRFLDVNPSAGMSQEEVNRRQIEFGPNRVTVRRATPPCHHRRLPAVVNAIVLVEIAYLLNCRSLSNSVFDIGWFTNRWAIAGSLEMLGAQLLFTYAPVMNNLFHTSSVTAEAWLRIGAVACAAFIAVEMEKRVRFGGRRRERSISESSCERSRRCPACSGSQ